MVLESSKLEGITTFTLGRLLDTFRSGTPTPRVGGGQRLVLEVHAAQKGDYLENFLEQKLKGVPENGGIGQIRSGEVLSVLRPHPGVQQQVQVHGGLLHK